jgi:hypothetical protein
MKGRAVAWQTPARPYACRCGWDVGWSYRCCILDPGVPHVSVASRGTCISYALEHAYAAVEHYHGLGWALHHGSLGYGVCITSYPQLASMFESRVHEQYAWQLTLLPQPVRILSLRPTNGGMRMGGCDAGGRCIGRVSSTGGGSSIVIFGTGPRTRHSDCNVETGVGRALF